MNSIFDLIFRFVPQFYPERIRSIYMLETDLIDKGFLSFNFTGRTCISVKQTYGKIVNELAIRQEKLQKEFAEKEERNVKYLDCARNKSTTFEECNRIRDSNTKGVN